VLLDLCEPQGSGSSLSFLYLPPACPPSLSCKRHQCIFHSFSRKTVLLSRARAHTHTQVVYLAKQPHKLRQLKARAASRLTTNAQVSLFSLSLCPPPPPPPHTRSVSQSAQEASSLGDITHVTSIDAFAAAGDVGCVTYMMVI